MDFVNPAVTDGVDLFVNIAVILIGFITAISLIDAKKTAEKGRKD
jgi:nucleoside permease NupC